MAIKGISLAHERIHESIYDEAKGTPEATRWRIGTIDSRLQGYLGDRATALHVDDPNDPTAGTYAATRQNEVFFEVVSYGLKGWENFRDDDGNDIKYRTLKRNVGGKTYEAVSADVLCLIPVPVIQELAHEILSHNRLSETERKN